MKRTIITLSTLTLVLGLTACSTQSSGNAPAKKPQVAAASESANASGALLDYYLVLKNTINGKDADLNAYETAKGKPSAEDRGKASESANAVAVALKNVQVPASLSAQKSDIQSALNSLIQSYEMMANELKKDNPSLDAANNTFKQGEEKIGKVFESLKLMKPSLDQEVNG